MKSVKIVVYKILKSVYRMVEDFLGDRLFENVRTVDDFYLQVSMIAGERMKEKDNSLFVQKQTTVEINLLCA